jgi:DNA-binding transcriptional ArsR family regulator
MNKEDILSRLPQEQRADAKKIIEVLKEAKSKKLMGMNETNIKKATSLSYTAITKVLSSLTTLEIIEMERQGSSKVYRIATES